MSNIVSSVLPKIPAAKVYACTISPFPYYNGNGQVEFDKVMVAVGDVIHLTNLSMTLVVVATTPYYQFVKIEGGI